MSSISSLVDNVNKFMPILMTAMFYSIRSFDWNMGNRLLYLRVVYGLVQVVSIALMLLVRMKILSKNDSTMIEVEKPKSPFEDQSDAAETKRQITVCTYDMEKWNELVRASGFQLLLLLFFHYKWGYAVPLLRLS